MTVEIKPLLDENEFPIRFVKGTSRTLTVTVIKADGTAQDISAWIGTGKTIHCRAKESLDDASELWDITGSFVTDGKDGKFKVTLTSTQLAAEKENIILTFYRKENTTIYYPFREIHWSSEIVKSVS